MIGTLRQAGSVGREGDLGHCLGRTRIAFDVEAPLVEDDVVGRCLEQVRGDLLSLGHNGLGRRAHGHPANSQAATAIGAVAKRGALGCIAVSDFDRLVGQPERVCGDLSEGGFVALAVGMRADEDLG